MNKYIISIISLFIVVSLALVYTPSKNNDIQIKNEEILQNNKVTLKNNEEIPKKLYSEYNTPTLDEPVNEPGPGTNDSSANVETKYDEFVTWLGADKTDEHAYLMDGSKQYSEGYVCAHFVKDFIRNASKNGYEVYAVALKGTQVAGVYEWHMIVSAIVDGELYFIEPQTDEVFKKEGLYNKYGYQYAYFGKDVHISRNEAELEFPIRYNEIIGLKGADFLYVGK